jgi:NAD(P)H-dependent flavin oxidoreductase YrpB (nitropropane dioxygenase family)
VLKTVLCDLLGIEHPILSAGMARVSQAGLVAAVSEAGGCGVLGGVSYSPEALSDQIAAIRLQTKRPFGVDLVLTPDLLDDSEKAWEPIETLWRNLSPATQAKLEGVSQMFKRGGVRGQLNAVLDAKPALIALAFSAPAWVVQECHARGIVVAALVGSVNGAADAEKAGVDFIVAQGTEGGGHTGHVGTFVLVPAIVDAVSIPVVAAGGVVDGRGLAAALAFGAVGVWVGTRFVASNEAFGHQVYKDRIVRADLTETVITKSYTGKSMRTLRNQWTDQWPPSKETKFPGQYAIAGELVETGYQDGDLETGMMPAGQGAALVHEVLPAAEIVRRMAADADHIIQSRARATDRQPAR